ncbi:murein L,D-transpeptidase [Rhodosalinus halophilus]|uniref:Murein L,D-transpeptidase n=1 Tax=Rhodosalinus halophilus TaxID=2259333 RepID=A0A365U7X0_9RHOB|nr:L,D-transpeptidase family protein [Rhodosalinus halophilus]RBI84929.1 murein L,D-transpeptidase [Rhodosalinus halophilus]
MPRFTRSWTRHLFAAAAIGCAVLAAAPVAQAGVTAFKQALAEQVAGEAPLTAFYRANGYSAIWTGPGEDHRARRAALLEALDALPLHGLPAEDLSGLRARLAAARTAHDLGLLEAELSRRFLDYARRVQMGVLTPSRIDPDMVREVARPDLAAQLAAFAEAERPAAFLRGLAPGSAEYARLLKARLELEEVVRAGGWGPAVPAGRLEPGDTGSAVVALRNRLIAMGYMRRSASAAYDGALVEAVRAFQEAHGLEADGVVGEETRAAINTPARERLQSVLVALERERWLPRDRGARHVLVNLTDFSARIIDDGKVTFETKAVVGARSPADKHTPEFSDEMEHMVINPSWYVPRSILARDYLPRMKRNRNAASYLQLINSRGQVVSRAAVNFNAYNARNFPFNVRQPPGPRNALGKVKFMFPNQYAIYLHDTPEKHLFDRHTRTYSSGCIRLQRPFEFAYELLSRQTDDPRGLFHSVLETGRETRVELETHVPVHLIYRTALTTPKGALHFRPDMYGRDARIWSALEARGVAIGAVNG